MAGAVYATKAASNAAAATSGLYVVGGWGAVGLLVAGTAAVALVVWVASEVGGRR